MSRIPVRPQPAGRDLCCLSSLCANVCLAISSTESPIIKKVNGSSVEHLVSASRHASFLPWLPPSYFGLLVYCESLFAASSGDNAWD